MVTSTGEKIMLHRIGESVRKFLASEDGPTAVEYAVMLALIIIVCIAAVRILGTNASTTFKNVATTIAGS
jgi:pilus assembly protein Flp/PilA